MDVVKAGEGVKQRLKSLLRDWPCWEDGLPHCPYFLKVFLGEISDVMLSGRWAHFAVGLVGHIEC